MQTIGQKIKMYREEKGLTLEEVSQKLNCSTKTVESWESDAFLPDTYTMMSLAELLKVNVTSLIEQDGKYDFKMSTAIFDHQHMKTFVKVTCKTLGLSNAFNALYFACEHHKGQYRKNSNIPYIAHPLNMVCHLFALGIKDDDIISATILHDVVEDCNVTLKDLPVDDSVKELVSILTRVKTETFEDYIERVKQNPKACLIKLIDRCNNINSMAYGFDTSKMEEYIKETEQYVLPLLEVIKRVEKYNDAAWLLKYQIESTLDIYKRFI